MIYTITLNPSLDRVIEVETLREDDANRMLSDIKYPGGKGIDVSRVLTRFGYDTIATGFLGGFSGLELEGMLINEGVKTDFVKIADDTRINIYIFDKKRGVRFSLNAKGPRVKPVDVASLYEKIRSALKVSEFVVMSGSIPRGVSENIYAQLIVEARKQNVKVVVDTDGEPLKRAIRERPFLIKPNKYEFERLIGRYGLSLEEIVSEARKLTDYVENIIVSMGKEGLLFVNKKVAYKTTPPEIEVKSTIGSGDSVVALFLLAKALGKDDKEACLYATAGGTATALTEGVVLVMPDDFYEVLPKVMIEEIK
jgi:6-phosphofructokinase 2